jgi:regulator of nucleoside diphosphate kinase
MTTEFTTILTARTASLLTSMLERTGTMAPAYTTLLRRKLREASICFSTDLPAGVVSLNSHVLYTVDGEVAGPHLIVANEGDDFPDYALSIHTLRGLALLGLSEGETITIAEDDVAPTMLGVVRVGMWTHNATLLTASSLVQAARGPSSRVVAFPGRTATASPGVEPDDPGPRAA